MRLGIISDTHDQYRRTAAAVALLAGYGAETIIHCGDITQPDIIATFAGVPTFFVFGNNDFEEEAIRAAIREIDGTCLEYGGLITLEGKRIGVTHGHLAREYRRLIGEKPDYLLYGHTHVAFDDGEESTRRINPGALHRSRQWTVAILDLSSNRLEFIEVS